MIMTNLRDEIVIRGSGLGGSFIYKKNEEPIYVETPFEELLLMQERNDGEFDRLISKP